MPARVPDPPWLPHVRELLFASEGFPALDEAFAYQGKTYVCRRTLTDEGGRLVFAEAWVDPDTYQAVTTWRQEIEAGAFAGAVPESVLRQQVAQLVQWLQLARPHTMVRERPAEFTPQRFAHHPRGRR
jgi:hypothetical protein